MGSRSTRCAFAAILVVAVLAAAPAPSARAAVPAPLMPWGDGAEAEVHETFSGGEGKPAYDIHYRIEVKRRASDGRPLLLTSHFRTHEGGEVESPLNFAPPLVLERNGDLREVADLDGLVRQAEAVAKRQIGEGGEHARGARLGLANGLSDQLQRLATERYCDWMCAAVEAPEGFGQIGTSRRRVETGLIAVDVESMLYRRADETAPDARIQTVRTDVTTPVGGAEAASQQFAERAKAAGAEFPKASGDPGPKGDWKVIRMVTATLERPSLRPLTVEVRTQVGAESDAGSGSHKRYDFTWFVDDHRDHSRDPQAAAPEDARGDRPAAVAMRSPSPRYPPGAINQRHEGTVQLWVRVGVDGHALEVQLAKSCGHAELDASAQAAVRSWTFHPAQQGGKAVVGWLAVPVEFKL